MSININTEQIKELRDKTGISVMQCKNALIEAEGNMDKALAILKKTSSEIAFKKNTRETKDGRVIIKIDGTKGVLVALLCETDFVSKNIDFINTLNQLLDKTFSLGVEKIKTEAKDLIDPLIQKIGENIILGEVSELNGSILGGYVHNNKIAVIVSLEGGNQEFAKDIAMHITAMKPEYIDEKEIDENAKKMMTEIFQKEIENIDKPIEIKKKMLEGKINSYFKEKTLLNQAFIKNQDETIGQLLEKNKAKIKEVKIYSI